MKNTQYGLAYFISIICLLIAVLIIFFNTNSAKDRVERDILIEAEAVEVNPLFIDAKNEGKYVILQGSLQTTQVFHDQLFNIKYPGVAYNRMSEVAESVTTTDSDGNEYIDSEWAFSTESYTNVANINSDSRTKGTLEYSAAQPIKIQKYTIYSDIFGFDRSLFQPIFLENYFDFDKHQEYYLVDNHIITNADDTDFPRIGAGRYSFYGIPDGTNVTMVGLQQDSVVGKTGVLKIIPGIKNKREIFKALKSDAEEVESGFNSFGLFFLIISALTLSYLIKEGKVFEPMHSEIFNLRLGRLIYIVLLSIFLFQVVLGFAALLFSGDPISSIKHFGYVALIVLATKTLFGRQMIPTIFFKDPE